MESVGSCWAPVLFTVSTASGRQQSHRVVGSLDPRPRYVFDQTFELFDSHRRSAEPPGERG
eukprot:3711906-Prymnesium_polylepis.1